VEIIDGTTTLHFMADDEAHSILLSAGTMVIVPQGMWRSFTPDGVTLITGTPQPTDVEDPRTLGDAE
jgi:hypothetical protein